MRKIPIWDFVKISKDQYFSLSKDEKRKLMKNYFKDLGNEVNGTLFI